MLFKLLTLLVFSLSSYKILACLPRAETELSTFFIASRIVLFFSVISLSPLTGLERISLNSAKFISVNYLSRKLWSFAQEVRTYELLTN